MDEILISKHFVGVLSFHNVGLWEKVHPDDGSARPGGVAAADNDQTTAAIIIIIIIIGACCERVRRRRRCACACGGARGQT